MPDHESDELTIFMDELNAKERTNVRILIYFMVFSCWLAGWLRVCVCVE